MTDFAIVESEPSLFRERLNRAHFAFRHRLAGHPLFELPRLIELCERIRKSDRPGGLAVFGAGSGSPRGRPIEAACERDLADLIGELPTGDKRLRLSGAQHYDDDYRALHDQILSEIDKLSGFGLRGEIGWSSMTILLSSPEMVTPYHMDHQSNLLFQITGHKKICIFDPNDRQVLTEAAIEEYYGGDKHGAEYQDSLQGKGADYELIPGAAVHNPPLGPHWVKNGTDVSVSMSINYSLRESEHRARVYQVNRYLRRLGLAPLPPGRSSLRDWMKRQPFEILSHARPGSLEELLRTGPGRLMRPIASFRQRWRNPL